MEEALTVTNLVKTFGDVRAVDDVTFSVKRGELYGFLGPNGAGKTTTINILATLLRPTSGSARVAGYDVRNDQESVRKSIGVVFQEPALDGKLTGRENLDFHAMMYGLSTRDRKTRVGEVLTLVELDEKQDLLVEKYSGGMKRRLEIARGLIHRPKVLFLDEPTLGLDAQTRRHIWEYIKKLNKETDVTIILTTHYMEEADVLCERITIIDGGKIAATDTPANLKDTLGGDVIRLTLASGTADGKRDAFVESVGALPWVRTKTVHNESVDLTVEKGETKIPELMRVADKMKMNVAGVFLHKPSLEDVFLHFTGKTIREEETSTRDMQKAQMRMRMRMRGGHR